jgi:hypothetical protein
MFLRLVFVEDVITFKAGEELRIPLSDADDADLVETMVDNLRMGSLQDHCTVKLQAKGQGVSLVAKYPCECFGHLVKEGETVLTFDVPGDVTARRAFGDLLRTGRLGVKATWSQTSLAELAEEAAAAKQRADLAAQRAADAAALADAEAKAAAAAAAAGDQTGATASAV